jgi:hypothetical protein
MNAPVSVVDDFLEVVSTALDASGVVTATLRAFHRPRMEAIKEQLLKDLECGKIRQTALYNNPNVDGFIFRLSAAIQKGVRQKNTFLLQRYLFGKATDLQLEYDACVEDATIIESLTDPEMRCLAIYAKAIGSGQIKLRPTDGESPPERDLTNYTMVGIEVGDYFSSADAFHDASLTLQRWGFVRPSRTLDTHAFEPTTKLVEFMNRLDLEGIIDL